MDGVKTNEPASMDFSQVSLTQAIFLDFVVKKNKGVAGADSTFGGFSCKVNVHPTFNINEKAVKFELHISCKAVSEEQKPIGIEGSFVLDFTFLVKNMEEYLIQVSEIEQCIPSLTLMVPLAGTAYSTARGMIVVKALGTPLEGFSLPIINARELMQPKKDSSGSKKQKKASAKGKA